ncbi:monooxygenase family protein [Natronomonas sp. EA1]|uniref:monooxygenase family protein n=1 Tax=Natronomonas sp. EA1 TaxID=3421655 RepID=UPI003EBD5703
MSSLSTGRHVADTDGDFVIYINGMRLNTLRALPRWIRASRETAKIFKRLEADPDSGFLGYHPAFMGLPKGAAIQYWRSLEDLRRFANDPGDLHVPAWLWYNETDDGGLGFWAELYVIEAGNCETFYRSIEPTGPGEFFGVVEADERERRLGLSEDGVVEESGN